MNPTFVCWKWHSAAYRFTFSAEHVNALVDMLAERCSVPHDVICVTDDPAGVKCRTFPLWKDLENLANPSAPPGSKSLPSCYRRLKIFNPKTTDEMGIPRNAPVISIDLDCVLLADIAPIIRQHEDADFTGWLALAGHAWRHPWYFHGSLWRFKAGRLPAIWQKFNSVTSPMLTNRLGFFGSDQAWLTMMLGGKHPGWTHKDGIVPFNLSLHGVRSHIGKDPPPGTRLVFFNGSHKPWDESVRSRWPWIKDYWPPRNLGTAKAMV